MGKSAESKLERADYLDRTASKIKQKDPENARILCELARSTRKSAIKQMKRRPKRRSKERAII